MVDPIADFLTRIRNAQMVKKNQVIVPYSQIKEQIARVMLENKFLEGMSVEMGEKPCFKNLVLDLPKKSLTLKRVSKPGQRIYTGHDTIRKVLNGFGISIISTSAGVMTGREARKQNVGGELLCEIS